jgi:hypothetical protein
VREAAAAQVTERLLRPTDAEALVARGRVS